MKCEMRFPTHFQTSTVQPVMFSYGQVISPHILLGGWLFIHAGFEFISVYKKGPGSCLDGPYALLLPFTPQGHWTEYHHLMRNCINIRKS